jgi:hypothetical protein
VGGAARALSPFDCLCCFCSRNVNLFRERAIGRWLRNAAVIGRLSGARGWIHEECLFRLEGVDAGGIACGEDS